MSVVYFIRPVGQRGPVKIGHTYNVLDRLSTLASWSPIPLEIAATIPGNARLEARFHALFKSQHSHREWFRASDELDAAIDQIRVGTFDINALPEKGVRLWEMSPAALEGHEAQSYALRLGRLIKNGADVPQEVRDCLYGLSPTEEHRRKRRRVIKAFVDRFYADKERAA